MLGVYFSLPSVLARISVSAFPMNCCCCLKIEVLKEFEYGPASDEQLEGGGKKKKLAPAMPSFNHHLGW